MHPDDVVVTSGAQQAIHLASEVLLRAGMSLGLESTTYPGALELFRDLRLRFVERHAEAHAYYVMPALSNPSGVGWTEAERRELLERARRSDSFVIEDDAYAETVFSGQVPTPLLAHDREHVFHVGTLSKTLCPGLRIGWLVAPRQFQKQVMLAKRDTDLQANGLAQHVVTEYLKEADFDALLDKSRRFYRRRARRLLKAVRRRLPGFEAREPSGGFSLWLESEREGDDVELLERAVRAGVSFDPGSLFQVSPSDRLSLRLCFSLVPEDQIDEGVLRLARVLRGEA